MKSFPLLAVLTLIGNATLADLAPASPKNPTPADEARHALIARAKALPAMKAYPETWWADLASGKGWTVRKITAAEARHRVTDTLREEEKARSILHGTLDALEDGECWALENYGFEGGFGATPIAYLDAKTGALLFFWIAPEG